MAGGGSGNNFSLLRLLIFSIILFFFRLLRNKPWLDYIKICQPWVVTTQGWRLGEYFHTCIIRTPVENWYSHPLSNSWLRWFHRFFTASLFLTFSDVFPDCKWPMRIKCYQLTASYHPLTISASLKASWIEIVDFVSTIDRAIDWPKTRRQQSLSYQLILSDQKSLRAIGR